jgi:hypothetical protein
MSTLFTNDEFIQKSKALFGKKYDYSDTNYTGNRNKVTLRCIDHDLVFEMRAANHFNKREGCPLCNKRIHSNFKDSEKLKNIYIKEVNHIHNHKYDYSATKFRTNQDYIDIICPVHGKFNQRADAHKRGQGCPPCAGSFKNRDTHWFVAESKKLFPGKYDYSLANYIDNKTMITMMCIQHGNIIKVNSYNHLLGKGCRDCSDTISLHSKKRDKNYNKMDQSRFIKLSIARHSDKYDYSKVNYKNTRTKVVITCPEHGDFSMRPPTHYRDGSGCSACAGQINFNKSKSQWLIEMKLVHGDKYDYSSTDFTMPSKKVTIRCPKHGDFSQRLDVHQKGNGCPRCSTGLKTQEDFIELSRSVHGDKYDYSKVKYLNGDTKVIITCPEHGDFEILPRSLTAGRNCSSCANRSGGYNPSLPGMLYYLKINSGEAYKIGITNRTVKERFGKDQMHKIETLKEWHYENGSDAALREREILNKYKGYRYRGCDLLRDGNTELFYEDVLNLDTSII